MTELPERIWTQELWVNESMLDGQTGTWMRNKIAHGGIEYIRSDSVNELLFFATYIGPLVIDQAVEKVRELEHLSDMADDLILRMTAKCFCESSGNRSDTGTQRRSSSFSE